MIVRCDFSFYFIPTNIFTTHTALVWKPENRKTLHSTQNSCEIYLELLLNSFAGMYFLDSLFPPNTLPSSCFNRNFFDFLKISWASLGYFQFHFFQNFRNLKKTFFQKELFSNFLTTSQRSVMRDCMYMGDDLVVIWGVGELLWWHSCPTFLICL
jgi:hypothetical protein